MPVNQIGYNDRQDIIREMTLRLADQIVDVELDSEHYNLAIDKSLSYYRQLSSGSVEMSFLFLNTSTGVTEYTLPDEVQEVNRIYRRGIGTNNSGGSNFDPFDVAFNNMYMLNAGQMGGLAVFDAFAQYKETIGRIFGSEYNFNWNRNTKVLKILRNVQSEEEIAIDIANFIPEAILFKDVFASPWIADMALAQGKLMLGEARGKYLSGLPGAGGAIQLNGEQLKAEAKEEIEALREQVKNLEEGSTPLGFTIG
jgi:hypothetical protein